MRNYTLAELEKLKEIRASGFDDSFYDDHDESDRSMFVGCVNIFLKWLNKMEQLNRIDYLLTLTIKKNNDERKL